MSPPQELTYGDWNTDTQASTNINIEGDTFTLDTAIPDSVIHHYPASEGSGSTIADAIGSADVTDFSGTWTSDTAFEGGTAPFFDRSNDTASATPTQPSTFNWAVRVRANSLGSGSPTDRIVFSHAFDPTIKYNVSADEWRFQDGAGNRATVAETQSSVEGSIRYLFWGLNSSTAEAYVYDESKSLVGSDSFSSPNQTYADTTMYIGHDGGGSRLWGGEIDNWYLADALFDSTNRQSILDEM